MTQLELFWGDSDSFKTELETQLGFPVQIVYTDNTSSLMSFKHPSRGKPARLRIHRMFLAAQPRVIRALARWLTLSRTDSAGKIVDEFIRQHEHLIRQKNKRHTRRTTRGEHFNLMPMYEELNVRHFGGVVNAGITWGRFPTSRRRRRSIRLGSYTPEDDLIRIHPLLDQDFVPEFFVRYIVFHEMLHAYLGVDGHKTANGRRRLHTREFRDIEEAFPDYRRAVEGQDNPKNLNRLLKSY